MSALSAAAATTNGLLRRPFGGGGGDKNGGGDGGNKPLEVQAKHAAEAAKAAKIFWMITRMLRCDGSEIPLTPNPFRP